jgi:F0F1-type ATP synthase membrane subunit b/b'
MSPCESASAAQLAASAKALRKQEAAAQHLAKARRTAIDALTEIAADTSTADYGVRVAAASELLAQLGGAA